MRKTQDDKFVSVGAIEPQFFAVLIEKLELDEGLKKVQNDKRQWPAMHETFETVFASKTRDEWSEVFTNSDACVAPVLDFSEAKTYPANALRNVFFEENGITQTSVAPRFSRTHPRTPTPALKSGMDNASVLTSLGFNSKEVEAFSAAGVLL